MDTKTDLEIKNLLTQREFKKNSLKRPFMFGLIFGLFIMLLHYLGYRRDGFRSEIFILYDQGTNQRAIIAGCLGFAFTFSITLWHQRHGVSFFALDNLLADGNWLRCNDCKELSQVNLERRCQCGGKLEPSEFYDWEEA